MSWDAKARGGKYYYRSLRVNGRAVKKYVGTGPLAELAARLDEREREVRRTARVAMLEERTKLAGADLVLDDARSLAELLVSATLILNGWHQHHGQWRRRRGQKTQGDKTAARRP